MDSRKAEYRVVILGEGRVGKTSLARKWVYDDFDSKEEMTTKPLRFVKEVSVGKRTFIINIWDTAGQARFHAISRSYYRNSAAALVVFSVTSESSFAKVEQWINELRSNSPSTEIIIVGSKCDLQAERRISSSTGKEFADSMNLPYFEVSAKTSAGVSNLFSYLAKLLSEMKPQGFGNRWNEGMRESESSANQSTGCC